MTHLPRLASLVFGRPHYITPDAGRAIAQVIMRSNTITPDANRFAGEDQYDRDAQGRPMKWKGYRMFGATAVVTVIGELVNRGAWLGASSGLVSYEGLAQQLRSAAADPRARRILLDVNSPGGEAAGMTDIAALVRSIAAEKPVVAVANSMMCSAAYGLCSGATRIVTTELGVVGSIGVVMMHADYSRALDEDGIAVTLIHEGAHKVDGNPFEPLPDEVRDDFQAECGKYYQAFLACVATGRPQLSIEALRATEARTYLGAEAVELGLADAVGTFDAVLAELEGGSLELPSPGSIFSMSLKAKEPAVNKKTEAPTAEPAAPAEKTYSQAEYDAAVSAAAGAAKAEGRAEERARIKGIVSSEAADGRSKLAAHLAFESDMAADAAVALMSTAPQVVSAQTSLQQTTPGETLMGLELAQPAATKPASTGPVTAKTVYQHRRAAN